MGCCTNYLGTDVPCPVVLPHQGDGAVHQVTSHPTQVPAVMVRYTRLPHTPPRYQPLWCGTPGYLTLTQVPAVMLRYTRLPHTPPKYQLLRRGTPGYPTPHPNTISYGTVLQITSHPTQVPAVMGRYTRLPHTPIQVPAVLRHQ